MTEKELQLYKSMRQRYRIKRRFNCTNDFEYDNAINENDYERE